MLKLENITKDYVVSKELTVHALKGVSINFRKCEFVSVLGASGCGKTTLLNIIGGLDRYTSGDVKIDGISTVNFKEQDWNAYRNHRVGFVFQNYNLIPHQSVRSNVELALTLSGVGREERRKLAENALKEVGLEQEMDKRPNQLSGGQMQRVAIARALVNNPDIILADEPTGALDSVTSVQVMDLLKKIAETRLVVMVTHNNELAEQYSTRIIRLHDGEVVSDSRPYDGDEPKAVEAAKKKHVGMSYFTALSLSFKNLLTKKGRTIMTSIAGSIGIIGVALVLALSNGFNSYIANLQSDTLSGYPVTISRVNADLDAMYDQTQRDGQKYEAFPQDDFNVHVYSNSDRLQSMVHYNYITPAYVQYVEKMVNADAERRERDKWLNDVQYSYATSPIVIAQNDGTYTVVRSSAGGTYAELMASIGGSSSVFQEALGNSDFVKSQYDVLQGKYPEAANEIAVIVDSRNRIEAGTLSAIGIPYTADTSDGNTVYRDIAFDQIIGKQFKLVYNNAWFAYDEENDLYTTPDSLSDEALQQRLAEIYADEANTMTLKIVGIMRVNEDAPLSLYNAGLLYLPQLTQAYLANSKQSDIALTQSADSCYFNLDVIPSAQKLLYVPTLFPDITKTSGYVHTKLQNVVNYLKTLGGFPDADETQAMQYVMQQFGASDVPTSIYLYPKNFDVKDKITSYLDDWNNTEEGKLNKIVYTDATAILSDTMGQMIDIISYVLIAFASISLVVSSVMIGIITYVSVIERTKEIGVLRSIGASKNDISNVFNAESFLIGLTAGLIGVAATYLLCIPLNAILIAVAGGAIRVNLAVLNPLSALVLVVISFVLTLIAGFIPSRFAAKLDPVKALRSE